MVYIIVTWSWNKHSNLNWTHCSTITYIDLVFIAFIWCLFFIHSNRVSRMKWPRKRTDASQLYTGRASLFFSTTRAVLFSHLWLKKSKTWAHAGTMIWAIVRNCTWSAANFWTIGRDFWGRARHILSIVTFIIIWLLGERAKKGHRFKGINILWIFFFFLNFTVGNDSFWTPLLWNVKSLSELKSLSYDLSRTSV